MPSWDIFERETQAYRDSVLPPTVTARVAIEQASTFGWERYVGTRGKVIGMHTFGASAPLKALQQILCGWTAAGLGRLSFHTSMEATDAIYHLRDRCRDRRPGE